MDITLLPAWMRDAITRFDQKVPLPEGLLRPEVSQQAYMWYIQGRSTEYLVEATADVEQDFMTTIDDKRYYVYPAVNKPVIGVDVLYEVLIDLFNMCHFYDTMYASIPLDMEYYEILKDASSLHKLYDYDVEIMLLILCPWYIAPFRGTLGRVKFRQQQNIEYFVNPDPNKMGRDYVNAIRTYLPAYLNIALPNNKMSVDKIMYPTYDIIPRKYPLATRKIVNMDYIPNNIYSVNNMTLLERLQLHLPDAVKNLNWRLGEAGCIVAGGFLQVLSNNMLYERKLYKESDIDIFVYGYSGIREMVKDIVSVLRQHGYNDFRIANSVINAYKEGSNVIQIVCTNMHNFYQIIYRFDNSASQLAYDGTELYCTPEYHYYVTYGMSRLFPPKIRHDRVYKLAERGYIPTCSNIIMTGRGYQPTTYTKIGSTYINEMGRTLDPKGPNVPFRRVSHESIHNIVDLQSFKVETYYGDSSEYLPITGAFTLQPPIPGAIGHDRKYMFTCDGFRDKLYVDVVHVHGDFSLDVEIRNMASQIVNDPEGALQNIRYSTLFRQISDEAWDEYSGIAFREATKLPKPLRYYVRKPHFKDVDNLEVRFESGRQYNVYKALRNAIRYNIEPIKYENKQVETRFEIIYEFEDYFKYYHADRRLSPGMLGNVKGVVTGTWLPINGIFSISSLYYQQ